MSTPGGRAFHGCRVPPPSPVGEVGVHSAVGVEVAASAEQDEVVRVGFELWVGGDGE